MSWAIFFVSQVYWRMVAVDGSMDSYEESSDSTMEEEGGGESLLLEEATSDEFSGVDSWGDSS